jgi:hypothetical protein
MLAVVDVYLMVRMIRRGPEGLGYWPMAAASAEEKPLRVA